MFMYYERWNLVWQFGNSYLLIYKSRITPQIVIIIPVIIITHPYLSTLPFLLFLIVCII